MTSGQDNIYIGYAAIGNVGQNNQFSIGNVIYGSGMGTTGLTVGRVGIGTMTPTSKLDVVGTGTFQGIRILSGASNGYVLTSDASGNARWALPSAGDAWTLSGNAAGANDFIGTTNTQDLVMKVNNTQIARFYSTSTGGTVIGKSNTISPTFDRTYVF